MFGAVIGDIAGSIYEWNNIKTKDFILFEEGCHFTDETVINFAVANGLMRWRWEDERYLLGKLSREVMKQYLTEEMQRLGRLYPLAGYAGMFQRWLIAKKPMPYRSLGNGAAMRVAPIAYVAASLEEAEELAKLCAEITHNHSEGIKGAVVVAGCIYLSINGADKEEIKAYAEKFYDFSFTLDEIRPQYGYNSSAEGSIPYAIAAFLEGSSFEDSLRNAISIGGDSDTIATITCAIAEGYYGIPEILKRRAMVYLKDTEFLEIYYSFMMTFQEEQRRKKLQNKYY
ncbi:ADP-ribosylglycohydrolase family protein [Alloiococcus sp. CFN-8]|uniref:ADP-ribosylglycohydrolase family protein n=1 Tax=Alloiococcus sp. CFN-8 TaxID=3416081 RepID=UPI003CF6F9E8